MLGFPLIINAQTAFISGNDTICDNEDNASIKVDFTGTAPFTFVYSVNGVNINAIITQNTPYISNTKQEGLYLLEQFNDASSFGSISGSGLVTVLESPESVIHLPSDTLSILYPVANFVSKSIGNIVNWDWNFGDNTVNLLSDFIRPQFDNDEAADYEYGRLQRQVIKNTDVEFDTQNAYMFWPMMKLLFLESVKVLQHGAV